MVFRGLPIVNFSLISSQVLAPSSTCVYVRDVYFWKVNNL